MTAPDQTIDTNWCSTCGGALRVIDGTDYEEAGRTGQWHETYRCSLCDGTGTLTVDTRAGRERATGVVVSA